MWQSNNESFRQALGSCDWWKLLPALAVAVCIVTPEFLALVAAAPPRAARSTRPSEQQSSAPGGTRADSTIKGAQLPALAKPDPVFLAELREGEISIDVINPEGNLLDFRIVENLPQQEWSITDGTRPIARIVQKDRSLQVFWHDKVPSDAECLRNVVLKVASGNTAEHVALRKAVVIDAPPIDLSKTTTVIRTDVALWGLPGKALKLEALGLTKTVPRVEAYYPANRRADFGKTVRMAFHDKPPHAVVQLRLLAAGDRLSIKGEPLLVNFAGNKTQPWTLKKLEDLEKTLAKHIQQQEEGIPAVEANIASLKQTIRALKQSYNPDSFDAPIVARNIGLGNQKLSRQQSNLARMQELLPINRRELEALKPVHAVSDKVHQEGRLVFRVYYLVDGREVEVMRARPTEAPVSHQSGHQQPGG